MGVEGWVYLVHPATGGGQYFPDKPDVLRQYEAKGWEPGEEPQHDDAVDAPLGKAADPESEPAEPANTPTQQADPAAEKKE